MVTLQVCGGPNAISLVSTTLRFAHWLPELQKQPLYGRLLVGVAESRACMLA
jgi:hypothetical protein